MTSSMSTTWADSVNAATGGRLTMVFLSWAVSVVPSLSVRVRVTPYQVRGRLCPFGLGVKMKAKRLTIVLVLVLVHRP